MLNSKQEAEYGLKLRIMLVDNYPNHFFVKTEDNDVLHLLGSEFPSGRGGAFCEEIRLLFHGKQSMDS